MIDLSLDEVEVYGVTTDVAIKNILAHYGLLDDTSRNQTPSTD